MKIVLNFLVLPEYIKYFGCIQVQQYNHTTNPSVFLSLVFLNKLF